MKESQLHGILADRTQLPFYRVIQLPFRVRGTEAEWTFVVSRIGEDTTLGMPFLVTHKCHMDFKRAILQVDSKEFTCTDRHGRLLLRNIQVMRKAVVPPETDMNIQCRVTAKNSYPVGLIEGRPGGLPVATSLNNGGQMPNFMEQPMKFSAGSAIGIFTRV